jgi:hypothetical protein
MDRKELLQLMHGVLDRTATDAERAELDRALSADPAARAEFDRLQGLFGALAAMPAEAPVGLVDDVMAALHCSTVASSPSNQPFSQSGVLAPMGSDIRVRAPSKPITARTPSGPIRGRQDMSKRGLWIIGGVAAAVIALFVGNAIDFPASGDKATGTIVPADRVRSAQPSATDVKLVDPSRRPSPGVPLATGGSNAGAANLGAGGNSNLGAAGNSNLGAAGSSNLGAAGNSNLGAAGSSNLGAGGNSNLGAAGNSNLGAAGNSNLGAVGNSNLGAGGNSNLGAAGNSNLGAGGNSNLGRGGNSNLGAGGNSNLGSGVTK